MPITTATTDQIVPDANGPIHGSVSLKKFRIKRVLPYRTKEYAHSKPRHFCFLNIRTITMNRTKAITHSTIWLGNKYDEPCP